MANLDDIYRGSTKYYTYQHMKDGEPEPLVNTKLFFTVKTEQYDQVDEDDSAVIQVTKNNIESPDGVVEFKLTPDDTTVEPGTYFYDIRIKEPDTDVYVTEFGKVKIVGTPTNRSRSA